MGLLTFSVKIIENIFVDWNRTFTVLLPSYKIFSIVILSREIPTMFKLTDKFGNLISVFIIESETKISDIILQQRKNFLLIKIFDKK